MDDLLESYNIGFKIIGCDYKINLRGVMFVVFH